MVWREWCRSEAYERVVPIQTSRGRGAAFTIDRNGRQWLITARQLLPDDEPAPGCVLSRGASQTTLRLGFLADPGGNGDVAVALLQSPITSQLELHATSEGLMCSQSFTSWGSPTASLRTPDRQIESASEMRRLAETIACFTNGSSCPGTSMANNPAFSGGPVVASAEEFHTMQVIGIVLGNRSYERPLEIEKNKFKTP
jgi:hypothetical protein